MIINKTYFDGGTLNIPGTELDAIQEKIDDFISVYEPEYLQKALGYPLWKLFSASLPNPANTSRFYNLLNGIEYTDHCGNVQKWIGFNTLLNSPIAMYVWYWYSRDNATYSTSQGEQKGKTENADNVSVAVKQTQFWNKMSRISCQLWDYLKNAKTDGSKTFPEWKWDLTGDLSVINHANL